MDNRAKRILQGIIYVSVFFIGLIVGTLLCRSNAIWRDRGTAQTGITPPEMQEAALSENKDLAVGTETPVSEADEIVVDYPFSYGEKGWSLVLRKSGGEDVQNGEAVHKESARRSFCLYDENGQLLQEFPCGIVSAEVIFRYDVLFDYYKDMIVYPADAPESGAEGLCYQWEREKQRFAEVPVTIPWYQEGSVRDKAFLVCGMKGDGAEENVETKSICRIHQGLRRVVELRRWTVCKDVKTGEEILCIRDCLEEQDIYTGKMKRYDTGNLKNEKYYQFLFWEGLETFWGDENDSPIRFCNEHLEQIEYEDKQAFLADHGFAGSEAFYEYRDRFGNLIMEIYFDQQAGRGCGIRYYYSFNDKLKKRATRDGFAFEEVETGVWEPQEEFSKLTVYGDDVSKSASGYKEIYKYTDDGKISSFEARGMDLVDKVPMEVSLLSLDYIYRDDGTLYHREYHHYPKFFSSAGQSEDGDYDKQGRLVYRYSYITHGAMDEYYLYDGNHKEPKYRLFLDWGASNYAYVRMIVYDSAD